MEPDPRQSAYEVEYWRQKYEMLVNKVMAAQPVMAPPTLLTHAESYEAGRLHGAIAEREACAQILDRNADACRNNSMLEDVLRSNAAAIRARSKE